MQKILICLLVVALLLPACAPTVAEDCADLDLFCVGLVTDGGKITDQAFNQAAWDGLQQAKNVYNAKVDYIETVDWKDYYKNITAFAVVKYDVIVVMGSELGEATTQAAKEYPDIYFIGIDQTQPSAALPNLAGLVFPEDQAGFLAGALAAQLSKSGKIGGVFASDVLTSIWRIGEAYRAGAQHIKPEIEVSLLYHNEVDPGASFSDPEWGATTAASLVEEGADVVFGAGEKTAQGALVGAVQAGALGIGYDIDQYNALPEAQKGLVSSVIKLVTPGVFHLIVSVREAKFAGGNMLGEVDYAPFHALKTQISDETKTKIWEVRAALLDGTLKTDVPEIRVTATPPPSGGACEFYVFQDGGATVNQFVAEGRVGDVADINIDENFQRDATRPNVIKIMYAAQGAQGSATVYWWLPGTNWGNGPKDVGLDLSCATKVTFWARGEKGGEKAEFKIGGIKGTFGDSLQPAFSNGPLTLTNQWTQYTIDLTGKNLSHIMGGFSWFANKPSNPQGAVIYLDDIKFEQ
jgi:basic membrane protein A